jgi:hypothetical protein
MHACQALHQHRVVVGSLCFCAGTSVGCDARVPGAVNTLPFLMCLVPQHCEGTGVQAVRANYATAAAQFRIRLLLVTVIASAV